MNVKDTNERVNDRCSMADIRRVRLDIAGWSRNALHTDFSNKKAIRANYPKIYTRDFDAYDSYTESRGHRENH